LLKKVKNVLGIKSCGITDIQLSPSYPIFVSGYLTNPIVKNMKANKNKQQATDDLSGCLNIGKDTEAKLKRSGIDSVSKLKAVGTEQAFLRLQAMDPGACIQLLYGLDGAVSGIKATELSQERKEELKAFHRMTRKRM
jgi:DNA transformation protein